VNARSLDPKAYSIIVLAKALEIYARTGVKVNTAYMPSVMMRRASELTGKTFRARDYLGAAQALKELIK
jgi:hypothetical protein